MTANQLARMRVRGRLGMNDPDGTGWNLDETARMEGPFGGAVPSVMRDDRWAVDIEFGRQFTQGPCPHNFRVVHEIPFQFRNIPDEILTMVLPKDSSLMIEAAAGRLMHVTFEELGEVLRPLGEDGINPGRHMCYPEMLLYQYDLSQRHDNPLEITTKTAMVPLAITLRASRDHR